jgi:uncharacterized protein
LWWPPASSSVFRDQSSTERSHADGRGRVCLAPFGARFTASAPFRPTTIRSVYGDDDTVIVVWDGRGVANDGVPYGNSYAWIMRLRDGMVIDGTAFYDSISFNDLWTRVHPRS